MIDGADEFRSAATARHARALEVLLARDAVPTDRRRTWHAVASVLLVTVDGRILLARNRRGWGTAGGHVEPHDRSLRATAVREAREELGVLLAEESLRPLSFVADEAEFSPGCAHWDFCFVLVVPEAVEVSPADDVLEARWFAFDALPEVNDHMRQHITAARAAAAA